MHILDIDDLMHHRRDRGREEKKGDEVNRSDHERNDTGVHGYVNEQPNEERRARARRLNRTDRMGQDR